MKPDDTREKPRPPIEYTFNWVDTTSSPLVPNLTTEDEFPDDLERLFVNAVARGESESSLDERIMSKGRGKFYELTLEGIRRWHIRGKER